MRRLLIASLTTAASFGVGGLVHAQGEESATPTTLALEVDAPVTVESEDVATVDEDDDDDTDNTGLWGLLGLLGLLGLAGLARRRRVDTVGGTPPVGPAAPRTAQGATGTADYDR